MPQSSSNVYVCAWCKRTSKTIRTIQNHMQKKRPCSESCQQFRQQLVEMYKAETDLQLSNASVSSSTASTPTTAPTPTSTSTKTQPPAYTIENFSICDVSAVAWLVHYEKQPAVGLEKFLESVLSTKPGHGGVYASYATSAKNIRVWDGQRFKLESGTRVISQIVEQLRQDVKTLSTQIPFGEEWMKQLPYTQFENSFRSETYFPEVVARIRNRYLEYLAKPEASTDILRLLYNMKDLVIDNVKR